MINAVLVDDVISIYTIFGRNIKNKYDFFTKPINSSNLNIYLVYKMDKSVLKDNAK